LRKRPGRSGLKGGAPGSGAFFKKQQGGPSQARLLWGLLEKGKMEELESGEGRGKITA